ncbi:delta 12 fatty acid epoxygenase [Mycena epipterygia]|nr:delta 12 fatty acid epoxygenase [Mycena epipterygia]
MKDIRAAIPPEYFVRDTPRAFLHLGRDLTLAGCAWSFAMTIDPFFTHLPREPILSSIFYNLLRWGAWCCGHGVFSPNKTVNDAIGFIIHSLLFTPYFSWKISHHRHHMYHASMTRDETYVPKTRSDLGLPKDNGHIDYDELFGDTPLYTLLLLVRQQVLGFPAYLNTRVFNVSGQKWYPKGTNHFNPTSDLFTSNQWRAVVLSDIGLGVSAWLFKLYLLPWLVVTHWFVMITYLQHTDPKTPHFRGPAWTFQRGAAATIDRPNFLGWQGRFFLHHVVQFHTIHHFFPKVPFYHGPAATQHLKAFLGEHYISSDTPAFQALWENYNR